MNERDPLVDAIRRELEAEADGLSGRTRAGLAAARRTALANGRPERGAGLRRLFAPGAPWLRAAAVGGLAAALVLTITFRQTERDGTDSAPLAQIELMTSGPGLEFYENLQFSAWLAEAGRAG